MGQVFSHLLPIRPRRRLRHQELSSASTEVGTEVGTQISIVKEDGSFSNKAIEELQDEQPNLSSQETSQTSGAQKIYLWSPGHAEKERLQEQYQTLKMLFNGQYHFAPTQHLFVKGARVLDINHGDLSWAMDMAEEFPEAEIHIVDFRGAYSATELPDNIQVHICDVEDSLPFPDNHFDYIRQAMMGMNIKENNWQRHIDDCVRVIKKDAPIELFEIDSYVNDPGPVTDTLIISLSFATRSRGVMPNVGRRLKELLEGSKVRDVSYEIVNLPIGDHGGPVGTRWKDNFRILLEDSGPFFCKLLGLPIEKMKEKQAQVLQEFEEYNSYHNVCISYGFKR